MLKLRSLSFGMPAAIVTSMGLIVGLDTATATKAAVLASLLITGIADNLTDSLSVHIYQESERMAERQAFRTTVANYISRLIVSTSFILLFLFLAAPTAIPICIVWGFLLLSGLSYLLAKARRVSAPSEIVKHAGVAFVVIAIGKAVGLWIQHVTAPYKRASLIALSESLRTSSRLPRRGPRSRRRKPESAPALRRIDFPQYAQRSVV